MAPTKSRSDAERLYLFVQHLSRKLRDVDLAAGMSPARVAVLTHLRFHKVNNVSGLAAIERVSRPAMTRLVRDMEKSGLVRRLPNERDGRGILVRLTQKGQNAVDRLRLEKIASVAQHLDALRQNDLGAVRRALGALESFDDPK
jgi:DNA-binding MarR family transcriptional regulator